MLMLHLHSIQVLRRLDALQALWIAKTASAYHGQCLLMTVEQLNPIRQGRSGPSLWTYTVDHRLGSMPLKVFLSAGVCDFNVTELVRLYVPLGK